jgi:hypothetical protein
MKNPQNIPEEAELVQPATTTLQLSNNNLWDANAQGASVGFQLPPDLPAYPELLN